VVAGLPELAVGLQFAALAWAKPYAAMSAAAGANLMRAEFLVIHSFAFLGLIGQWQPPDAKGRKTRAVAFWGLFGLYCVMAAWQGWQFFFTFFGLCFVTYLGLFMTWRTDHAVFQLWARWGIGTAIFLVALGVFDAPKNAENWSGRMSVVKAGALYFLALAALEMSGLYLRSIPKHREAIADWMARSRRNR
jgi:hypothetical protein